MRELLRIAMCPNVVVPLIAICAANAIPFCLPVPAAAQTSLIPISVSDDRGVKHVLAGPATRVAAVADVAADFLIATGDRPVGISVLGDRYLPIFLGDSLRGLPDVGSRAAPNLELLAQLRPDAIVAIRRYTEGNASKLGQIAPYFAFNLASTADSFETVTALGRLTGHEADAAALNEKFKALLGEMSSKAPGGVSAAFVYGEGTDFTVYYDNYMTADLMNDLKVANVVGPPPRPGQKYPFTTRWSLEDLFLRNPDYLFIFVPKGNDDFSNNPIWHRLKAVRSGHAYSVGVQWLEVHGPIGRELVLREMGHLIYPNIFPQPEMPERARAVRLAGAVP